MPDQRYWLERNQRSLGRRRLLIAGAAGATGIATAAATGCRGQKKTEHTSSSGTAGTPQTGGTLTVFLTSSYPLDPQKVSAGAQRSVGGVLSRVFKFKTGTSADVIVNHTPEPDLGLSAESPDALTWTVKLRPDARFQNIPPVNSHAVEAEDVRATFMRALDPATSSPNRGQLNMIDSSQITTPDKQTFVFKLNYQYAPFRSILSSPAYSWILPREALAGDYDPAKVVIGSGPFRVDNIQPDVVYSYKKNPDWHGRPQPYVDALKIAIVPDVAQQMAQFLAGNLDELNISDVFNLPTVQQQNPKATIVKIGSSTGPFPLYFQLGDPSSPFVDIRVRRAISMAVDRDALSRAVFNGQGSQAVYVPGYMGKWALPVEKLDGDIRRYYEYNPGDVKQLLAAAGQPNLQVRLVNPFFSQGSFAKQVEVINQSFNATGIRSTILNGDYNKDFVNAGHGWRQGFFDKDMVMFGSSASYTEADDWLFSYFHSKSTSNQERLNDPVYDAMIDKERTIVNDDERVKAIYEIQKYLAQQMYAPSTVGSFGWWAIQPRVQNYSFSDSLAKSTETYAKIWLSS